MIELREYAMIALGDNKEKINDYAEDWECRGHEENVYRFKEETIGGTRIYINANIKEEEVPMSIVRSIAKEYESAVEKNVVTVLSDSELKEIARDGSEKVESVIKEQNGEKFFITILSYKSEKQNLIMLHIV